jgi:hypothetical protein
MNTIKDTSSLHHNRSHLQTSSSRLIRDTGSSTLTTMLPVITHPHDNSVISMEENLPHRLLNAEENFEKFSTSLLKNKTLLVPRHLALKRQRASLKLPNQKLRPVYSDTLQMELGNPEGFLSNNDRNEGGMNTMMSQYIRLSPEKNRIQSTSNDTTPLRGDTPQTAPTDISLLYRYVIRDIFSFESIDYFPLKQKFRLFEPYVLHMKSNFLLLQVSISLRSSFLQYHMGESNACENKTTLTHLHAVLSS